MNHYIKNLLFSRKNRYLKEEILLTDLTKGYLFNIIQIFRNRVIQSYIKRFHSINSNLLTNDNNINNTIISNEIKSINIDNDNENDLDIEIAGLFHFEFIK